MNLSIRDVCRSCLKMSCSLTDKAIDEESLRFVMHIDKIRYCFCDLEIKETVGYKLCKECFFALQTSYNFKKQTYKSELTYNQYLETINRQCISDAGNLETIVISAKDDDDVDAHSYEGNDDTITVASVPEPPMLVTEINNDINMWSALDNKSSASDDGNDSTYAQTCVEETTTADKHIVCAFCNKSFNDSCLLAEHEKIHFNDKKYACVYCNKAFTQQSSLTMHERSHATTTDELYECRYCDKTFGRPNTWSMHEKTHTGSKPFVCKFCRKAFSDSVAMNKHERIHTGEKPYSCRYCEKTFSEYSNKLKHERTHTGEKPYTCHYCDKSFSQLNSRMRHERIHTGERPYTCRYCPKCFSDSSTLIKHEKLHRLGQTMT